MSRTVVSYTLQVFYRSDRRITDTRSPWVVLGIDWLGCHISIWGWW